MARMIHYHQRRRTWHEQVDRFIVLTEFAKSRYAKAGLPMEKFAVKPNFLFEPPAPPAAAAPRPAGIPRLVYVGRLSAEKGIATLLHAKKRSRSYQLDIVGDGPLREEVRRAAAEDEQIIWHGFQQSDGVCQIIRESDALIFPSECYENFPITLLEAMALGKAAVVSDMGGLREIVVEGDTGWVFEARSAESLAAAIEKSLEDQGQLAARGDASRARYESLYGPEKNFARLKEIYQSVME
jgi:glycosyltransferase involved in cell wall biosynthesis